MLFLRSHLISKVLTFVTAIAFLNMGFFLAEVKLLKLDLNEDLVENIAELILTVGMEEERDVADHQPDETGKTLDEFFVSPFHANDSMLYVLSHLRKWNGGVDAIPDQSPDQVTPPPEA